MNEPNHHGVLAVPSSIVLFLTYLQSKRKAESEEADGAPVIATAGEDEGAGGGDDEPMAGGAGGAGEMELEMPWVEKYRPRVVRGFPPS